MAGVSFSMVRPQRLVEDDNENLVEENSNNLAQRLKQQQMATDTKVSRVLERLDRPSLKCSLQIILLTLLTIAVIIIAAKLLSSDANDQANVLDVHQKILQVLTRGDYKSPEAVCPKLFSGVGPPGRWDSCYYFHRKPPGHSSSEAKTMEEARRLCSKIGGHVLALETKEEVLYIQRLTSYEAFPSWIAASNAGNGVDWLWIGTGKDGEDAPINYSYWANDEPKHKEGYHCAHIADDSTWVTTKCDSKRAVMCEAPAKGSGTLNLLSIENQPPERFCPSNSSSCYLFVNTRLRWQRAQDYCVEHGGYLARPDSLKENTLLKERIYASSGPHDPPIQRVRWLGAQGKQHEMKWISNGRLLSESFQDWRWESVPDEEDLCLAYNISSRLIPHHWSAESCFRWLPFICEITIADEEENVEASVISESKYMSIVDERAECAFESNGVDYRGTRKSSSTGSACLPWRFFHSHQLVVDALFNHNLEENFCRNPNNESAPWCFVGSKIHPRWEYCNIPSCKNEDFINESHLCGPGRLKYGLASTCDGNGERPCCSAAGFCGSDRSDCKCFGCKDFRPDEFVHPLLGPGYVKGENGLFYGHKMKAKTWDEARKVCKEDGGDLAGKELFQAKDVSILLRRVLAAESKRYSSLVRGLASYWLGLSTSEQFAENDAAEPWKWVSGETLNRSLDFKDILEYRNDYQLKLTKNVSASCPDSGKCCAQLRLNRYRNDFGTFDYSVSAVQQLECESPITFICEVSVTDDSDTTTTAEPSLPLVVTSINSSFTLHFVKSQKSHDLAEKFCAENFPSGKLIRLNSEAKREEAGKLALEVIGADNSALRYPEELSSSARPPETVLSYWWVGEGSTLTSRVKLAQGNNVSSGNVYIGNQPVCDDGWDHKDAQVVCRQLGFLNGTAKFNSYFGVVPSNFAMDQVECLGHEEYLKLCPHAKVHDCGSSEGAGVICRGKQTSEQIATRRQKKVCQRVAYFDESLARYNPPWSTLVQVNCQFSHWFICESDAQRKVTQFNVINGTRSDS